MAASRSSTLDARDDPGGLGGGELARRDAEGVLQGQRLAEARDVLVLVEQEQVADLAQAAVDAGELLEAGELGHRAEGDADVQLVGELGPEAAGRAAGRARGQRVPLEQDDVRHAQRRKMERRGCAHRPAADDDHVRRLRPRADSNWYGQSLPENAFGAVGGLPIANIRDLASRSGVSVATVSRVMNNYGDVSDATRKRVLEIAKELDYTPSAAARTLVTRRSHVVGVVLSPGLRHPFFQEVLYGLRDRLGAAGFDLLIFAADHPGNGFGYHDYLKRCQHHRLDGVALMGVDRHDPEVHGLLRSKWPCVFVDLDLSGARAGYVMSDNYHGAELATQPPAVARPPPDRPPARAARLAAVDRPRRRLPGRARGAPDWRSTRRWCSRATT